jgi:hypothetical protein
LGKYAPQFQSMIRRESGYDPVELFVPGPRNHSTAGAIHAIEKDGPERWLMRKLQRYSVKALFKQEVDVVRVTRLTS